MSFTNNNIVSFNECRETDKRSHLGKIKFSKMLERFASFCKVAACIF